MAKSYVRSDRIVERDIHGENILVPIADSVETLNSIYALNETASYVWKHATKGVSDEEIISRLVSEFNVEEPLARQDTQRILSELVAIGALQENAG